ncbi:hypothetical protein C9J03_06885 [Photobacterium gaetbulicola]|uniref:Lipoprotein n=1 Tax=Photobacterium gaetbulicola Gung47 TaxID=658445 RepID=A0A0C5WIL3_9GAMM|nr:hypothetical protein [Photobacterium gaetbulicola]AJR06007.1 hypothetical protein H744_1c0982 [Photobacterium gaetbulicola Gung47]PSU13189.1 hypothetical protein C9J03_06885 [Photobacterium gaetbulicola]
MKKALFLFSALALIGCDDEDVVNTLSGNAEVFAVTGAEIAGAQGYTSIESIENTYPITLPDEFPAGSEADLDNKLGTLGIDIDDTDCGVIDTRGDVCFGAGSNTVCVPDEVTKLGIKLYTIDMDEVRRAYDNGFYPKLAADFLGETYANFDIERVSCASIGL